ncbi:R3H domain-containing nucleic acid-binding protein [Brachybacterium sp. ACRRE]|uniref:Jag family protein n=1 Tax=Brachybacterium sp. ACRRE TaxID=2918184 RepID=UPI001EF3289D|nr:R3H domain-containing nucleic acid-binding protein [Brachybacterium sp. ACRRE]MCG7308072.1 RNA-binding protein [Brachybacterium sp. ACRRE]
MTEPSTSDDAVETPETPASAPVADSGVDTGIAPQTGDAPENGDALEAPTKTAAPAETAAPAAEAPASASDDESASPEAEEQQADEDSDEEEPAAPRDPAGRVRELEEEGDIAADYLEELLDIADLDGDIDIDVDGDRASVEIRGADRLAKLNGSRGELLDALQELARLAVQSRTGNRSRLMLDIGGFRAQRKDDLEHLAEDAVATARENGRPVPLRPMNPFERKVVHDVAKQAGLRSESDGDGKDRHVVIYPAS